MKKIYNVMIYAFFIIIFFFTLYGKKAYELFKPYVEVKNMGGIMTKDGNTYLVVPQNGIYTDAKGAYVIFVTLEQGFSMGISTANVHHIIGDVRYDMVFDEQYICIAEHGNEMIKNMRLVVDMDRDVKDGDRVIIKDS